MKILSALSTLGRASTVREALIPPRHRHSVDCDRSERRDFEMDREFDRDYEPNPEDERLVDLGEEGELPAPPPTVDPDERIEFDDDEVAANDADRPEPV